MPKIVDLTNKRFDKLTALRKLDERNKNGSVMWECRCACNNIVKVSASDLVWEKTKSCGCTRNEAIRKAKTKHGLARTPEYMSWFSMKCRCYDPKNKRYKEYAGRGITVCDAWRESFETFYADMGPRPSARHTLDRENNDLGYSKDNCRWATPTQQNNNRRNTVRIQFDGEWKPLSEWCREFGIEYAAIYQRLRKGMSFEDALDAAIKNKE